MYRRILVAFDGSPESRLAVDECAHLITVSGREIHLVCVVHDPRPSSPFGRTFTVEHLGNVVGAPQVVYLNVEKYAGPGHYDGAQMFIGVQDSTSINRWSSDDVTVTVLQPLQPAPHPKNYYVHAPLLYLPPHTLLAGLAEQYLFAALHELLYTSLMAENQRRMKHMDGAVRRLEQTSKELVRRRNLLRQEEITEEIEVIMLSVEALK